MLAGCVIGWARGGRTGGLSRLSIRALPVLAIGVLLVLAARVPWISPRTAPVLTSIGYLAALGGLWLNMAHRWVGVVLVGTASNALAIIANGGRMPVTRAALERLGGPLLGAGGTGVDPRHILATPGTPLAFLGDHIAVGAGRLAAILSPGDLLMGVGLAGLVQAAMCEEDPRG